MARFLQLLGIVSIIAGVWGVFSAPAPWALASAPASRPWSPLPYTNVNPLGAKAFLEREVDEWKRRLTLQMAREAGIGWLVLHIPWEDVEPRKGRFQTEPSFLGGVRNTWDKYDAIVAEAHRYGIRLIARLDRPPAWARPERASAGASPVNLEDYGEFVATVARRYRGRIQHFQVWNEPNLYEEWGSLPPDPSAYARLLHVAARRIREANPDALVLSAPLAQTLERSDRNLSELDYLEALYAAGARESFDILMANAYGFDRPPEDPPDPGVLNMRRVELVRDIMVRHGDAQKPVWIAEFGWNAAPASFPPERLPWRRVDEAAQADYTERGLRWLLQQDWIGVVNVWYLRQVGDIPVTDASYYFRLIDTEFTPRPAYYRVATLGEELRTAGVGRHEETSPAVTTQGSWALRRLPGASGGSEVVSQRPGDTVRFDFYGTAVGIVHHVGPRQGRLLVSLDGEPVRGLPRDGQGRSYLDLYSENAGRVETSLAQGLRLRRHTLELTVAAEADQRALDREVILDGFIVDAETSPAAFYQALVALGAGLGLLLLSRSRRS